MNTLIKTLINPLPGVRNRHKAITYTTIYRPQEHSFGHNLTHPHALLSYFTSMYSDICDSPLQVVQCPATWLRRVAHGLPIAAHPPNLTDLNQVKTKICLGVSPALPDYLVRSLPDLGLSQYILVKGVKGQKCQVRKTRIKNRTYNPPESAKRCLPPVSPNSQPQYRVRFP